ncbi:MAG: RNA polymerase sigma factor [Phycisphaerae bacterium]
MLPDDTTHLTLLIRLRDRSDELSWDEFHDRYGELLYRYARGRGASHADAEDIVQEVELALFKAMDGFVYDARRGRFRGYLRSAVVHALGRHSSKHAREHAGYDPAALDCAAALREASTDGHWEREWRLHRLRWALRSVAGEFEEKTLQAFQAHALGGMSVEETAEKLGLSKASVYQAKSRVIKRLKEKLEAIELDEEA